MGFDMQWEVEQKFAISNPAATQQALVAAGIQWDEDLSQADSYWNHPARDFAATDEALRLRQVGEQNFITYKGPRLDRTTKTRRELEVPLADGTQTREQFGQVLAVLGFRPVATVRKLRRAGTLAWQGQTVHVAWDEVQDLGKFVELEIVTGDAGLAAAKSAVQSLAQHLDLKQHEHRSYLELLLAKNS